MQITITPRVGRRPTLVTAPVISDIATVGQTSTATPGVWTGSPTVARQWLAGGAPIAGATGPTFTATAAEAGAILSFRETATNAFGAVVAVSNALGPIQAAGSVVATFGTLTPAGTGGWRPRRGTGAVEDLAAVSLLSGSPGATPSVAGGRLVWSAALTPAASGCTLRCTGVSGTVYGVTVAVAANRLDLAQTSDLAAWGRGGALAGQTVVFRQNAQAALGTLFSDASGALAAYDASPPLVVGEGTRVAGEHHVAPPNTITTPKAIRFQGLTLAPATGFTFVNTGNPRLVEIDGCHFSNAYLDKTDPTVVSALQTGGFVAVAGNTRRGIQTNSGDIDSLIVRDCVFEDCYLPLEVTAGWYLEVSGTRFLRTYFDAVKNSSRTAYALIGGNALVKPTGRPRASAGGYADDPHHDGWQHTGVGTAATHPWETHFEANMVTEGDGEQANSFVFFSDDKPTSPFGRRTVLIGNAAIMDGAYFFTSDSPDRNLVAYNAAVNRTRTSYPLVSSPPLGPRLSRLKTGEDVFAGTTTVHHNIDMGLFNGTTAPVSASSNLDTDTLTSLAAYQAAFPNWTTTVDPEPSWAEVLAGFAVAGPAAGLGPAAVVTPGAPRQSDYAISAAAFPNPVLSGLSVTPAPSGFSASVTTDNPYPRVMWAVTTTAAPLAPDQIRRLDPRIVAYGKTLVAATATAPYAVTLAGGGLPAGTPHWLHVYQPFGKRGSAVLTQGFTPA